MKKVLIINLPKFDIDCPPLAPAILQSIAKSLNYETKFVDLNLELTEKSKNLKIYSDIYYQEFNFSISQIKKLFNFFNEFICDKTLQDYDYAAISFFSFQSIDFGKILLLFLKLKKFKGKIIIGGPGISRTNTEPNVFLQKKLIDYYVIGDGEEAFKRILTDNLPYDGVNNYLSVPLNNLDELAYPDFSNFLLDRYPKIFDDSILSIEGSRGCVRDCTFCDIRILFKKFRYKSSQRIFTEIRNGIANNFYNFWFTDSLVNGNQKEFRKLLKLMADYNNNNEKKIRWTGQYIIRPQKQYVEDDFILLKESGCFTLATGIESYSEKVRYHMGKNFSNSDIKFFLKKCQQYNLQVFLMMIIGYPTETEEDYKITLSFFDEYKNLAIDKTISGLQLGETAIVIKETKLDKKNLKYQNLKNINKSNSWINDNSDLLIRIHRRLEAEEYALKCGFDIRSSEKQENMFARWIHAFD